MSHLNIKVPCDQILSQAPDAILYADREGIIQFWNQGAERIFGFSTAASILNVVNDFEQGVRQNYRLYFCVLLTSVHRSHFGYVCNSSTHKFEI